jgi:putative transposase
VVLTLKGFRDLYLLIFLHVETRRAFIVPSTFHPNETWVKGQAQAFLKHVEQTGLGTSIVMHDRDAKFTASFDAILKSANLDVIKSAHRSPNTVAFVERFIQTLQQECLDYFVGFGAKHMDHLVSEMLAYYHEERPHQSKGNDPLASGHGTPEAEGKQGNSPLVVPVSGVGCRERLGGLLKHYYRKAA